jgi:hypothetical protein
MELYARRYERIVLPEEDEDDDALRERAVEAMEPGGLGRRWYCDTRERLDR